MPNRPTYGDLVFGSSGMPPNSTYKIASANNRLQKNMYGGGYSEVMDYGAIDAFPNPGYGPTAGMQDDDILVQKIADVMQNQFVLKPTRTSLYTSFPRVVLQGDLATKGEASYRVYKVLWAGRYKHCRAYCSISNAAWRSFS
jgi:hypothetical protein